MNNVKKILAYTACAFVFCFLAIGYAALQDELVVSGSVSVKAQNKVFAVYGEAFDSNDESLGMALNFYNRPMPEIGDTLTLTNAEGTMTYGSQNVAEIYTGFDTTAYTESTQLPWYQKDIVTVTVVDEGIAPVSTARWFDIRKYAPDASGTSRQLIKSINDIGKLNTSKVTNMTEMFRNCSGLTSLDLSGLETENVTNMSSMFRNCQQLTSLDLRGFDTENVNDMSNMFLSCQALKVLDLSTFNTTTVFYMTQMFNCSALETVYVSELWNTANVYLYSGIFASSNMIGGAGTTSTRINEYNHKLYARIDGGTSAPGYFTYYKYSLVFEGNNNKASNVPALMLSPIDNTFTLPDAPSHPWATFLGWATSPDATTAEYQPGDTFISSSSAPCCDVLYAVWDLGITAQTDFATAVEQANGNNVIIGGGDWVLTQSATEWEEFNPDKSKRLNLTIWDGNFAGWLMYITNADIVINGGVFPALDCFYMNSGATVTINGGDWSNITSFIFTEVPDAKVTGGTFGFNPSAYVPAGYTVIHNGDNTYTVIPDSNLTP